MRRVAIVTLAAVTIVLIAASPTQAVPVFEEGDRLAGPTTSTGIHLDVGTVLDGRDRVAGPTTSTGIPFVRVLSGVPIGFY